MIDRMIELNEKILKINNLMGLGKYLLDIKDTYPNLNCYEQIHMFLDVANRLLLLATLAQLKNDQLEVNRLLTCCGGLIAGAQSLNKQNQSEHEAKNGN